MEPYQVLEREWAQFNELPVEGMVACSSGTAALHLSLEALRLPQGSEILIPDYTMIACPRAAVMAGLTPVLVDCGDDLLMDINLAESEQDRPNISALLFVHVYGRRCDMSCIYASETQRNLRLIEDLAEAHGVKPHNLTDAACWSFYRNKIIAGEEGGAVWFRDPEHAALARQLRTLGFTEDHDYRHVPRGHNYRMSNLHAELILRSLRLYADKGPITLRDGTQVDSLQKARREIEAGYQAACPTAWRMPKRDAIWVYDVRIPGMMRVLQRDCVLALQKAGITARYGFWPMSRQEEFKHCRTVGRDNAFRLASEILYLPVQPGVTRESDCRRAFEVLLDVTGGLGVG